MRQADIKAGEEYTNGKRGRRVVLEIGTGWREGSLLYAVTAGPLAWCQKPRQWMTVKGFARWSVARVEEPGR